MAKVRVADYIAEYIEKRGVQHVFMLSGTGSIYLDDGIAKRPSLKAISFRNEAVGPMMAAAYSRVKGTVGVVYVTTGPGGANAVTGVVEAWVDSSPVLVISGQVRSDLTSYEAAKRNVHLRTYGIQELNIVEIVKSITKYAAVVERPEDIRMHLDLAFHHAILGRRGPVWLDIPFDIQAAEIEVENLVQTLQPDTLKEIVVPELKPLYSILQEVRQPVIVVGQGMRGIGRLALPSFLKKIPIPVIASRFAIDLLPFSYPLYFGQAGVKGSPLANLILRESDCIISLGCRLSPAFVGEDRERISKDAKIVSVDIDVYEQNKQRVDLKFSCSVESFLYTWLQDYNFDAHTPSFTKWVEVCQKYKKQYSFDFGRYVGNPIDFYYFIHQLDLASPSEAIFVNDAGTSYYICGQALQFEKNQREITSGTYASMGVAIPAAIGAAVAAPNKQVLAVVGDGSIETNIQELKTLSVAKANVKVFVINNGGYVSIRSSQDLYCEGRHINSDQGKTSEVLNFEKVAAAFDLPYYCITDYRSLPSMLEAILHTPGPCLVEVICNPNQTVVGPLYEY